MSSQSSPLARLWVHAQTALTAFCSRLMPLDTLLAGERRKLRAWLRALGEFCRRLALTEALALARGAQPPRPPAPPKTGASPRTPLRPRRPVLRLWSKVKRPQARIRVLGAAASVRAIEAARRRNALIARLKAGRGRRKPAHLQIADRIEALQRFLDAPTAAIRRFARKLAEIPSLARAILARPAPSCPFLSPERVAESDTLCYAAVADTS